MGMKIRGYENPSCPSPWQVPEGIKIRGLLLSFFLLWSTIARHQILKLLRLRFFVLESFGGVFFFKNQLLGRWDVVKIGCIADWLVVALMILEIPRHL